VKREDLKRDVTGVEAPSRSGFHMSTGHLVGIALVLILVPLMLLALPLPPTKFAAAQRKQDWVNIAAIVTAVVSAALYWVRNPLFPRRSILPLVVLGTSLLLMGNIAWNKSFREYVKTHDYHREVFRRVMRNVYHWPIYGRYDNAAARWNEAKQRYGFETLGWVVVSSAIAAAWYAWVHRRPVERAWNARSLAALVAFQLAMIVSFALCEPPGKPGAAPMRLTLQLSGYSEFAKDIPAFNGIADTLRNYVSRMPTLEWYGQHYPPGNLILLQVEKALGLPGFAKVVVSLLTVLTVIPLYHLAREIGLSATATTAALLLFAANTGVLIFCTINTTPMLLLPATVCLWMLVRSLKYDRATDAAVLGLCFTFYLFFSFSASILGVLMALITAIGWGSKCFSTRNILRAAAISVACVFAAIALLYVSTRFNLIACFVGAVRGHQAQQGNEGFDDLQRYLLRSTGNILAYLISIVPLCIVAISAMWFARREREAHAVFLGVGATVLIAGLSGLFYVETERIWMFLTPAFALAAGWEVARRTETEGRRLVHVMFLLVLLIACSQEFLFQHYR